MTPNPCICCGAHAIGYVFFPKNQICRVCRDSLLTYLARTGIAMADTHPFVRELCEESHALKDAWWKYYNSDTQMLGQVLRIQKKVKDSS